MLRRIAGVFLIVMFVIASFAFGQEEKERLSYGEARILLLKSIIFPGWGEHALKRNTRGYVFNFVDIGLWAGYFVGKYYGRVFHNVMVSYAVLHAGIDPAGKDMQFYTDIGNYPNVYEYNEQKLRYRQVDLVYPVSEEYFWSWDSEESRKRFDKLRIRSGLAYRNASIVMACLVINRIASVIDIIALTKNRLEEPEVSFNPSILYLPGRFVNVSMEISW